MQHPYWLLRIPSDRLHHRAKVTMELVLQPELVPEPSLTLVSKNWQSSRRLFKWLKSALKCDISYLQNLKRPIEHLFSWRVMEGAAIYLSPGRRYLYMLQTTEPSDGSLRWPPTFLYIWHLLAHICLTEAFKILATSSWLYLISKCHQYSRPMQLFY